MDIMPTTEGAPAEILAVLGACDKAITWARAYETPQAAWDACDRGDYLTWYLGRTLAPGSPEHRRLVIVLCDIVRPRLASIPADETRPRVAIETAERWARGADGTTIEDVRAASAAASAAAYAAAAYTAAYAYAAAYTADAAAYTAAYADDASAYAAYAAAYTAATAYAAANADRIRAAFPTPPRTRKDGA